MTSHKNKNTDLIAPKKGWLEDNFWNGPFSRDMLIFQGVKVQEIHQ